MSDKIGLFTGSFDPITNGHVDIIERASRLFDQLYVGVFFNESKQGFLPIKERVRLVEQVVADLPNVSVIQSSDELAVSVAKRYGVTHLVRGLRNGADLAYEMTMEFYNQELDASLETIYLTAKLQHRELSSRGIRELIHFKAPIEDYVPSAVAEVCQDATT